MKHKKREITVYHPVHGETTVKASSRLDALMAAAKAWGVFWVDIAFETKIDDLGGKEA